MRSVKPSDDDLARMRRAFSFNVAEAAQVGALRWFDNPVTTDTILLAMYTLLAPLLVEPEATIIWRSTKIKIALLKYRLLNQEGCIRHGLFGDTPCDLARNLAGMCLGEELDAIVLDDETSTVSYTQRHAMLRLVPAIVAWHPAMFDKSTLYADVFADYPTLQQKYAIVTALYETPLERYVALTAMLDADKQAVPGILHLPAELTPS